MSQCHSTPWRCGAGLATYPAELRVGAGVQRADVATGGGGLVPRDPRAAAAVAGGRGDGFQQRLRCVLVAAAAAVPAAAARAARCGCDYWRALMRGQR